MGSPTLALLITYHNEGELLTDLFNSLDPNDPPDEILLFDDASTILPQAFIPKNFDIKILRSEENVGPARGRNILFQHSKSNYVHFHDADDLFLPDAITQIKKKLNKPDVELLLVEHSSYRLDGKAPALSLVPAVAGLEKLLSSQDLLGFSITHYLLPISGFYRRSLIEKAGGYPEEYKQSEDYCFHIRLALLNPSFEICTTPFSCARIRNNSRSTQELQVRLDAKKIIEHLLPSLPQSYYLIASEKLAELGSQLFQLGCNKEASAAFATAPVKPQYLGRNVIYRFLARSFGPLHAERIAFIYRWAVGH